VELAVLHDVVEPVVVLQLRDRDPDGAQVAMHRHLHNVADCLLGRR
jgi:DNA-binding FadR family transcriptional regulator